MMERASSGCDSDSGRKRDSERGRESVRPLGLGACCAALGGLPCGLFRPTPPDRDFLASLQDVGLPPARTVVSVRALPQVSRSVATPFIAEGVMAPRSVGSAMTAFVVAHPEATFVIDPGICAHVRQRAVAEVPFALRLVVKPPEGVLDLCTSLEQAGIREARLDFALPTHLHWDHVAGLLDLPELPVRIHATELDWAMTGDLAPAGGVRNAVRGRPISTYELDGPPVLTFARSHDLFDDGSVTLVELTGHTPGSVGVLLRTARGPVLLAGDAAWHCLQVEHIRHKASFPGNLVDEDRAETFRTLHRLHAVRTVVRVVPTHDPDAVLFPF